MAGCDNLYGDSEQWQELYDFMQREKYYEGLEYLMPKPSPDRGSVRICYIPNIQDWLAEHCKMPWVQEQLEDNFIVQRMICGKAHHED